MVDSLQTYNINERINNRLQRIANLLLLNASFINNLGLLNGKMGIAIFFYHYGRYSNTNVYTDYAGELIDEIYEEININTTVDFADGLTGIGWGIEYLVKNKFINADTDEALAEIDEAVYRSMLNRPLILNNGNDLFGYGLYCISRLHGHENDDDNPNTLVKKKHLVDLLDECERLIVHKRYLEFNILQLCAPTINSLLWFLLEMERLNLSVSKVRNVLKYFPEIISHGQVEVNKPADKSILNNLSLKVSKRLPEESIKEQYLALAIRTGKELNNQSKNDKSALSFLQSLNLQKLLYCPYINGTVDDRGQFTKAFEIIDNEVEWNKILDGLNKSNLGLTGLSGAGLLLIDANDLHVEAQQRSRLSGNLPVNNISKSVSK